MNKQRVMKDKTYCINADCPFTECDKHLHQLKNKDGYVNVAAFDSVCSDYIYYLIDIINNESY